jgi:tRNA threonylcarbamoyladenosine biosynthesis protein TsaE
MKLKLADEEATIALAGLVLAALPADTAGWTVLLEGELGAGKSTFARALIQGMGHAGAVPSPTYTLVEPYHFPGRAVYHIDLYRINSEEELRYLGWSELEDGFRLVEWPDRAPSLAAAADLVVALKYANSGRNVTIDGLSERGKALVSKLPKDDSHQL